MGSGRRVDGMDVSGFDEVTCDARHCAVQL